MTLNYVLSALRRASENAYPWSVSPNEAAWLVAEVERLRAAERENTALRAEVDRLRVLRDESDEYTGQMAVRLSERDVEQARMMQELDRLRVLGRDTEARVTVEARTIATVMLKPVVDSWRAECDKERADTIAYLHMEAERIRRGEVEPANRENALLDMADAIGRGKHRRKP